MATNRFPNVKYITNPRDYNFFEKATITATTFGGGSVDGYQPDMWISFPMQSLMMINENSTGVVEYSFNGITVHGELNPSLPTRGLAFDNRVVSLIWFRVKSGSTGPIVVRVDAWGTR